MDKSDREILRLLQADNRLSSAEIGQRVGLSVSAASERIRRLNAAGVVAANRAIADPEALGYGLCAFLFVDIDIRSDEAAFVDALSAAPEVQELHHVAGSHSYLVKIRVRDTAGLQRFMATTLKRLPAVIRTETVIVLETHKETTELDPDAASGDD